MAKGIIYVMSSTALDGVVKIGKTEINQFESRMRGLERDGYRCQQLKKEFAIIVDDFDEKEVLLHDIFKHLCIADSELFALDKDLAIQLLSSFNGEIVYPKQTRHAIFEKAANAVDEKKEYDESYHLSKANDKIKVLFLELKNLIFSTFDNIDMKYLKNYVAFCKNGADVCDAEIFRDHITFYFNIRHKTINDPHNICEDCSKHGHHANGDWRICLKDNSLFKHLPDLIKQSYNIK